MPFKHASDSNNYIMLTFNVIVGDYDVISFFKKILKRQSELKQCSLRRFKSKLMLKFKEKGFHSTCERAGKGALNDKDTWNSLGRTRGTRATVRRESQQQTTLLIDTRQKSRSRDPNFKEFSRLQLQPPLFLSIFFFFFDRWTRETHEQWKFFDAR